MKFDTFAMGLGRSGSMALTNLLSQHPEINFPDKEKNGLLLAINRYSSGKINKRNIFFTHVPNWHIWYFEQLKPLLGFERMLHLVRHPYDVMKAFFNSQVYVNTLDNKPISLGMAYFDNLSHYLSCSHVALGTPLYAPFDSVKCISFEELAVDKINKTAEHIYRWLDVADDFVPQKSTQLAYANSFVFLEKLPLQCKLNGARFNLLLTRNKMPPAPRNRPAGARFLMIGDICLRASKVESIFPIQTLYCWCNVSEQTQSIWRNVLGQKEHLMTAINDAFEVWQQDILRLEKKIDNLKLQELPEHAKKKLYEMNKPALAQLYEMKPELEKQWKF